MLSIIIVNYNVKYFLEQCISSVIKASKELETEIIVADNASTDGSREYFEGRYPEVIFIWNPVNEGFGAANNKALKIARGNYILFLNPDTIIAEDTLVKCRAFMEAKKDCGALGVRMIDGSGNFLPESKRNLPTAANSFYRLSGLSAIFSRSKTLNSYYSPLKEFETGKVEVLAGAFMMLSRKAAELTGGFDTDFFMYGEDIDLSYRILKAGMNNYYYPETTIIHFKGESSLADSKRHRRQFYDAMNIFVLKHYGKNRLAGTLLKTGIAAGRLKAAIPLRKLSKTKGPIDTVYAIGDKNQLLAVQNLKDVIPYKKLNFISILNESENKFIVESIMETSSIKENDAVFFCTGLLENKSVIEIVGSQKFRNTFFWGEGTKAAVSSSDKNQPGKVLPVKGSQ